MRWVVLSWKNLWVKPLSAVLTLALLSLGVGMIAMMLSLQGRVQSRLSDNLAGIDVVVGAKGSPLQLTLSSVYHVDNPTGNVPMDQVAWLKKDPRIDTAIYLSYGDSYRGYRILGTEPLFLDFYQVKMAEGRSWERSLEVVLGASVAKALKLGPGDHFHSTHGLEEEGLAHDEHSFQVVGVLQPKGTVVDDLILTPVESIWDVHHIEAGTPAAQITAVLVSARTPLGTMQIPKLANQRPALQAAVPAMEVKRLIDQVGLGTQTIELIGLVFVLLAALSVFVSLYNAMEERRYERALLRSLGARPLQLFGLVVMEGFWLAITGFVLGWVLSRTGLWAVGQVIVDGKGLGGWDWQPHAADGWLLLAVLGAVFAMALIPALKAYRTNISSTLSRAS